MKKWAAAGTAAVVAAFFVLPTEVGLHIWNAFVSAGVLTPPSCSDFVSDGVGGVSPMCVRPGSLVVTVTAAAVAAAVVAGIAAFRMADRLGRR